MTKALIIGASGGIGAALSKELGDRGVLVTGLSRSQDGLDVTDPPSIERVLSKVSGPFDMVIVALGTLAAGASPEKSLSAIRAETMAQVYAINTIGPALILGQIERLLPRNERSVVVVLSARVGSIADNQIGGWHSYRASKAALNQILKGASIEIRRKRPEAVMVALHPGTVETPFTANYPAHRKVSSKQAARDICDVLADLTPDQTGGFFDYSGTKVPW